jgi:AMP phosphorylase
MTHTSSEKFRAEIIDIETGRSIVLIHENDARRMSIHMGDRVLVHKKGCKYRAGCKCGDVAIVDISDTMVSEGEVGIFSDLAAEMKISPRSEIYVSLWGKPESVTYIKKKIEGKELSAQELTTIINDIVADRLSDIELTAYVTASAIHGFTKSETVALTWAMVNTGDNLKFEGTTVDKHCIGGVPGNRTTLIVVPILAALGLKIPKTSSRAITSPAGTADTMEVLAPVNYGAKDVKRFVEAINGCIVWGGALSLAPADDKIIQIEYPLSIDAEGQVLASIISKKKSVDSDYVLIDIPYGQGSKMPDEDRANELGNKFVELGAEVGMKVKYLLTDGTKPIGNGIGPVLEARDVLLALSGDGPQDLVDKSVLLAGELLEFSGAAEKGEGQREAKRCLEDGRALQKMRQIIKMQKGNPNVKPEDLKPGKYKKAIVAETGGKVVGIDNNAVAKIARAAGAPKDPASGLYLDKRVGDKVSTGDVLFTVYSENSAKLGYALDAVKLKNPFSVL